MNILIIGPGAVGCVAAGILAKKGFNVSIACKDRDMADQLNTDGLIFKIKNRKYIHFIPAYHGVKKTPGNYDYVLLATKSFDVEKPAAEVMNKLTSNGLIVSLQDGYCIDQLTRIASTERVVGTVVSWGATMNQNGIAEMTSPGEMIIGKLDGSDDPRLDNLQFILNSIGPTRVVNNIKENIYSKLILNACITTLGALSGKKLGALIVDRNLRNLFIKIVHEAIDVANALNLEVPDFAGRINYYRLISGNSLYHRIKRHGFIRILGLKYRRIKSSGLQSLERGEQTETAYMNGYLVNKGKELGIDLPVNQRLLELMQEIEQKKRTISSNNVKDPLLLSLI